MAKKGVTLVLSGGGAKGLAHIGVLEELEKARVPIKRIVGTSAGALVGGFYAAGKLGQLKKFFLSLSKWDVFKLLFGLPSSDGILNSRKLDNTLKDFTKGLRVENLKIPFESVAFNLTRGEREVFKRGDLFEAIRSSISIPGFFKPVRVGSSFFIDGGVTDILPVSVAKKHAGEKIVAVNLQNTSVIKTDDFNIFSILNFASAFEARELARLQEKEADLVIRPDVPAGRFEFYKAKELIEQGRKAAHKQIPKIKKILS